MLNSTIRLVEYYLRWITQVYHFTTKLCDLYRNLNQTAFILLTEKFFLVAHYITGQRNTFATFKSANVISLFQYKTVSSPHQNLENQCFERIPLVYQNQLQFVDQVARKTFPWSVKAPFKSVNFDQQITLDADGDESCQLNLTPLKHEIPLELSRRTKLQTASLTQTLLRNNLA